jgi:hypothetical protein
MVKYLKTRKGYFYKLKKRYRKKNKTRKNKSRKNKKMIGGNLAELDGLDVSKKTIILIGELHTNKTDTEQYFNILRKQKEIIALCLAKFGEDKTYFYSEGPEQFRELILGTDDYSSSVIVQYAQTRMPVKLSSITSCDRRNSSCDDEYADDILSIFYENSNINCITVAIGLIHIPELKRIINEKRPDIKIVIVNTVSDKQLIPLIPDVRRMHPLVMDLLRVEPPYELPEASFIVDVLYNNNNQKIYKCPICGIKTGTAAPMNPNNTSLFTHNYNCPNKNKIPKEN